MFDSHAYREYDVQLADLILSLFIILVSLLPVPPGSPAVHRMSFKSEVKKERVCVYVCVEVRERRMTSFL